MVNELLIRPANFWGRCTFGRGWLTGFHPHKKADADVRLWYNYEHRDLNKLKQQAQAKVNLKYPTST